MAKGKILRREIGHDDTENVFVCGEKLIYCSERLCIRGVSEVYQRCRRDNVLEMSN